MRRFLFAQLFALLAALALASPAQARLFTQPELDALVAPIALYPDGLISDILVASTFPDQVEAAAKLPKDAQPDESWSPAVKQLVSFPDILARMVESPQWTRDLGEAFLVQEPHVLDTVQALRRRAQQQGTLKSNDQYTVAQEGSAIVVQPRTEVVYAPYYDPYVVYGPWWWPGYRPVYWSPWVVSPVFVSAGFFYAKPHWHHRHVTVLHKSHHHQAPAHVHHRAAYLSKPYHGVPESQRQPIVSSTPQVHRFDEHRSHGANSGNNDRRWQGRGEMQRPSSGHERRSQAPMPAAPRFSDSRPSPQHQQRAPAPQQQQRTSAPQQQQRASPPQQQQQRASAPQQQRTSAPQEPRVSASEQPRFSGQHGGGHGRGWANGGGGQRSFNGGGGGGGRGGGHGGGGRGGRG